MTKSKEFENSLRKILFIFLFIGILFFSIIFINKNIAKNKIYQFKNKTYYEVTLKPNRYFLTNKLGANNYYIASAIKSIDIYFDYYLKTKTKENINYSYDITATIKSYADNGTKLIWTKDFNIKNINSINQKDINIKETYNLDYHFFANYVQSFQAYYNVKTENYLYVKLNFKINDETNSYVLLTIPISENIIEITQKEDNDFLKNGKSNINLNKILVFIFIVIVIIILEYKLFFSKDNEKTFLKKYQNIIIVTQNIPNENSNNIIYLTNLKDLINIAINNNTNIFNYQNNYYTIIANIYYIFKN